MNAQRWQFSLVHLLMVVTVAAFFLAFAVKFPKLALGIGIVAGMAAVLCFADRCVATISSPFGRRA